MNAGLMQAPDSSAIRPQGAGLMQAPGAEDIAITQATMVARRGNLGPLAALAAGGSLKALTALAAAKKDQEIKKAAAADSSMRAPEAPTVLTQLTGGQEQEQEQGYAGGGRVRAFAGAQGSWNAPAPELSENFDLASPEGGRQNAAGEASSSVNDWLRKVLYGGKTRAAYYGEVPEAAPGTASTPDAGDRAARLKGANYGGITTGRNPAGASSSGAAAPGPRPDMSVDTGGPHNMMGPSAEAAALSKEPGPGAPPDAGQLPSDIIKEFLKTQTSLQSKRDALDEMSRKQLEKAYEAKVKNLTPSKYDQLMALFSGMAEHGGRSAMQAMGAGAQKMYGLQKASQVQLAAAAEAKSQADMLIQRANLALHEGDNKTAFELKLKAEELMRKVTLEKSTVKLQDAQGLEAAARTRRYDQLTADHPKETAAKTTQAEARLAAATRPRSGAGGVKPMSQVQYVTRIQQEASARATADGKDFTKMSTQDRDTYLRAAQPVVDRLIATQGTASPASPGAKFLGFE